MDFHVFLQVLLTPELPIANTADMSLFTGMAEEMPFQMIPGGKPTSTFGAAIIPGIMCVGFHVNCKITPGRVCVVADSADMMHFLFFSLPVRLYMRLQIRFGRRLFMADWTDMIYVARMDFHMG
jgi:hypothetical protein